MQNKTEPLKVLVIDDEKYIHQGFFDFLEDRNFKVLTAENGRIGLKFMAEEHPHQDLSILGHAPEKSIKKMRAETTLRKSEEKYRLLFENAVEGI